jgi:two-component system, NtrC family, response regulator AtoC
MPVAKNGLTILLGEDDLEVRRYLETALRCQGYAVEVAQDGDEVLSSLQSSPNTFSAIVIDAIMPRRDGIDALKEIRRLDREVPVIMIADTPSPLHVVEAMKNGASDFLIKPVSPEDLRNALKAALNGRLTAAEQSVGPVAATSERPAFFGASPRMQELQKLLGPIGWSDAPVLIEGETGAGKEVFARELHAHSPRAKKPILKLNCAALPSELVESELFGYERGAFTGAFQKKLGMFELADSGTILLDEIGDMDYKLQAKLLQVLQDQEFQRLGGKDTVHVNVRVIAATHRDLTKAIADNTFREDLYYRLNVINVAVPPLRDRKEDILPIAEFLMRKHATPGAPPVLIPLTLQEAFLDYQWPGNVRELENTVRRFLILRDADSVERDLRDKLRNRPVNGTRPADVTQESARLQIAIPPVAPIAELTAPSDGSIPVLEQVERANRDAARVAILSALKSTNWNRKQAALLLHIDYKALLYKMKGLSIKKEKAAPPVPHPESGSIHSLNPEPVAFLVEKAPLPTRAVAFR